MNSKNKFRKVIFFFFCFLIFSLSFLSAETKSDYSSFVNSKSAKIVLNESYKSSDRVSLYFDVLKITLDILKELGLSAVIENFPTDNNFDNILVYYRWLFGRRDLC